MSTDLGQHGRSSSLPDGDLSKGTPRGSVLSPVAYKPPRPRTSSPPLAWPLTARPVEWTTFNPTRPLSPIFSPTGSLTPTSTYHESALEVGPAVPPKPAAYQSPPPPRKVRTPLLSLLMLMQDRTLSERPLPAHQTRYSCSMSRTRPSIGHHYSTPI
jgi:hypothetical protein